MNNRSKFHTKCLSERSRNVLFGLGYNTKNKVRLAVEKGDLAPHKVYGYGVECHKDVCRWLGLDYKKPLSKNIETEKTYIEYLEKRGYRVTKESDE